MLSKHLQKKSLFFKIRFYGVWGGCSPAAPTPLLGAPLNLKAILSIRGGQNSETDREAEREISNVKSVYGMV
jgi:hypothetical protein